MAHSHNLLLNNKEKVNIYKEVKMIINQVQQTFKGIQ